MGERHVALVTGAGRGIGAAIARRLAREGAAVLVAARSQDDCFDVSDGIRAAGGTAWPLLLDVGDPDSVREAFETAREEAAAVGPIDWLVNNAGMAVSAPFLRHGRSQGIDVYEEHMQVNFHGARRAIEAAAPDMLERGYGRIVNVASSAALRGYAYVAAYVASKHALLGYSTSVARELEGKGVALGVVCPHYVDSPMTDRSVERIAQKTGRSEEEARALLAAENPGGTLVTPDEVAEVVHELLAGERNRLVVELLGGGRRVDHTDR